jgi:hypothetical protein
VVGHHQDRADLIASARAALRHGLCNTEPYGRPVCSTRCQAGSPSRSRSGT